MFTTKTEMRNGTFHTETYPLADFNEVVAMLANYYYKGRIVSFEVNGVKLTEDQMDEISELAFA